MKLVKLSLAAVVATGAMATFASATPLEEAIKGVEVSGMARYRFYHQSDARYEDDDNGSQRNRFSGSLSITSPIADNLKFGTTLSVNTENHASNAASAQSAVNVNKFWFQYAANGFSVKAGKFELSTPWTETAFGGTRGNGILALYSGVPNWTFAAAYFNQINGTPFENDIGEEDLMALAAIGSYNNVGLQAWASRMTNVFDYNVFAQVNVNLSGFNALAQMNYMRLDDDYPYAASGFGPFADDSGIFMGFTAGYKNDMFFVEGGYTRTDKDMGIYSLTPDDDQFIKFGQQLYYMTHNENDVEVFFLRGGAKYNKFGVEAGYGVSDQHVVEGIDFEEYYGLVSYQIVKNFSLQAYYSIFNAKSDNVREFENNEFRFQALYTF